MNHMAAAQRQHYALDAYIANQRADLIESNADTDTQVDTSYNGMLAVKRVIDTVAVVILSPFVLPLFLLVALAIKLESKGPVFFKQQRTGLNGVAFDVYKFRSMTCPTGLSDIEIHKQKHTARVTQMGRFMRKTSIDELPQLINVLRGDMSLIGPRPHWVYHDKMYMHEVRGYAKRFRMRPGITGLAQAHGNRGAIDTLEFAQARTDYDNAYIDNWTIGLDIWVALKTVWTVLRGTNAY